MSSDSFNKDTKHLKNIFSMPPKNNPMLRSRHHHASLCAGNSRTTSLRCTLPRSIITHPHREGSSGGSLSALLAPSYISSTNSQALREPDPSSLGSSSFSFSKSNDNSSLDEANQPSLTVDGGDEIDDHAKLSNTLLRLELEAIDDWDSKEEGKEFEAHDEAITRAILDRSQAGEDGMDVEERSSCDISFVIGTSSMALNSFP